MFTYIFYGVVIPERYGYADSCQPLGQQYPILKSD